MKITCSCGAELECPEYSWGVISDFQKFHARCVLKPPQPPLEQRGHTVEDPEPPAVTRAREILEECGIVDVNHTPADQLRPLVELIEKNGRLSEALNDKMAHMVRQGCPDAILTLSVDGPTSVKFLKTFTLTEAEFNCFLVTK